MPDSVNAEPQKVSAITKGMTISDAVFLFPEVIPILLDNGVHCVGCNVSSFETIEQGFKSHGMNDREISEVIAKMNEAANIEPSGDFSISEAAAEKLKSLLKNFDQTYGLKISVERGGCAGFTYGMELSNKPEGAVVIEDKDAKVFVDSESLKLLQGSRLEYIDTLQGAGFKISNPKVAPGSGCACGSSFSI